MVFLVEFAPFEATHFFFGGHVEDRGDPVDDGREIGLHFADILIVAMGRHVFFDHAPADPVQRRSQVILPLGGAGDEAAPLVDVSVVGIAELLLSFGNKRTGIHGIERLLYVERDAHDVDGTEPIFDFLLCTLTDIDEQLCIEELLLLILV